MKTLLIENMLTGFQSAQAARDAAANLTAKGGVLVAEYYDANNEPAGDLTMHNGFGHCVRLVIEVDDDQARIAYHRQQISKLLIAQIEARDSEEAAHAKGLRTMSEHYGEISSSLDNAGYYHRQILVNLGVKA